MCGPPSSTRFTTYHRWRIHGHPKAVIIAPQKHQLMPGQWSGEAKAGRRGEERIREDKRREER
jgi:hypothetical protein